MGSARFAISVLRSELPGRGAQAPRVLGCGEGFGENHFSVRASTLRVGVVCHRKYTGATGRVPMFIGAKFCNIDQETVHKDSRAVLAARSARTQIAHTSQRAKL